MGFGQGNRESFSQNHLPIAVSPEDENAAMQSGNSDIHQDQLQVNLSCLCGLEKTTKT